MSVRFGRFLGFGLLCLSVVGVGAGCGYPDRQFVDLPDASGLPDGSQDVTGESDVAQDTFDVRDVQVDFGQPDGDAGCGPTEKWCGECVEIDDPTFGCRDDGCSPCLLANAQAGCDAGACVILLCQGTWEDCDNDAATGCEIDTGSDLAHCGGCGVPCAPANATPECVSSVCQLQSCNAGFGNCDGDDTNGCERDLSTADAHCGECGHSCRGSTCAAGMCPPETLSPGGQQPHGIALDTTHVYWTDRNADLIQRVLKTGGTVQQLATGENSPTYLAVDNTEVFWVARSDATIRKKLKTGAGVATTLATGQNLAWGIAIDNSTVYWTTSSATAGTVNKVPKAGGATTTLASAQQAPRDLALTATDVFWVNESEGTVLRIPKTGGAAVTVTFGHLAPYQIALDAQTVFWTNHDASEVKSVPMVGGTPTTLYAVAAADTHGIAVDGAYVYWVNNDTGTVMRLPKTGGAAPLVLATGQGEPQDIAVDTTHAYWTNRNGGVRRVPK